MALTENRHRRALAKTPEPPSGPAKKPSGGAEQILKRLMAQYPEVQLATLVDQAPTGEKWVHEIKFDGYRLLGFVAGGETRLRTRNGNDWTGSFPAIASALSKLKADDAVLDMEAAILDAEGKTLWLVGVALAFWAQPRTDRFND
jgi:bifunctional non-homologous end joining protein LigD